MPVYAIAQLTITDPAAYQRYLEGFFAVFAKYSGTLLAADDAPEVIEGDWDHQKLVMMEFPDRDAFESWAYSEEYQRISEDRRAGTTSVVLLARGVGAP